MKFDVKRCLIKEALGKVLPDGIDTECHWGKRADCQGCPLARAIKNLPFRGGKWGE